MTVEAAPARKAARNPMPMPMPSSGDGDARAPAREALRPGEVIGRNGEVLSRSTSMSADPFEIPRDIEEQIHNEGYCLQWCRMSTAGQEDKSNMTRQLAAGWRPIEAVRFAGRFMPADHKGAIESGGLVLCERPASFNRAALKEMQMAASAQKRQQGEQFGMKYAPNGFEAERGQVKRSVEQADPQFKPRHQVAVED